jgi:hypothetical protein
MKSFSPIALALVCAVLFVLLIMIKHSDNARHDVDTGSIADFSNRLDSAQLQIATRDGSLVIVSNHLVEISAAAANVSNQLADADARLASDAQQITNLNGQVAALETGNQTLQTAMDHQVADLTNQMAGLTAQCALTQSNLDQVGRAYALLDNRLRRDVAERVVIERKFNNPAELQAQAGKLKNNPSVTISADTIYAGLDVEVKSNQVHVIAPN